MGRATRWLRNLLTGGGGGKKETRDHHHKDFNNNNCSGVEDRRQKKRWSFTKTLKDSGDDVPAPPPKPTTVAEAAWLRSLYVETEKEQSKHAIAVAAATAAAADAAVAAAQAAVAVVRLTSQSRGTMFVGGVHERLAAVKIQTAFRGFLAKKALRALKALVKLQALVRGYLVRKQAAVTFQSMQSLLRAQATMRAQRTRANLPPPDQRFFHELKPRRSLERFEENRCQHLALPQSSLHSRRLSANLDNASSVGYDRSPKIVEMDTCRPKSRSSRRPASPSVLDSFEEIPMSSPLPSRISVVPDNRHSNNFNDYFYDSWSAPDKLRLAASAQNTPRYANAIPVTPAKSICDNGFRRFLNYPNYMANTQSFEAKVRSQSAPKQRPEPVYGIAGARKRIPLGEMVESRASHSSVGMRRSCSQVQETFSFKSAIVGRLDRSSDYLHHHQYEREHHLHRKW